ncbi:hypothetical protein DL764_006137 [Monosporascus ibericus]|uniref:mRNA export factor GLE1 n=1 Tax=Monosporascus ibericus TaxID=155417 RepID=A0A4Q4T7P0_9PEZI|nr:hypothetical protein DL764_006137 [Monosporascus ibericus]
MPDSSPAARRSHQWSSPDRSRLSPFLSENRNTELSHLEALAAAQAEHERVREAAIRVYQTHELQEQNRRLREQQERIREEQRREEERIRNEERLRIEEERLRALKLKTAPKVYPEEPPSQPAPAAVTAVEEYRAVPQNSTTSAIATTAQQSQVNGAVGTRAAQLPQAQTVQQPQQIEAPSQNKPPPLVNPFTKAAAPQQNSSPAAAKPSQAVITPTPKPSTASIADRYVQIHQNLKKLRASMTEQTKTSPPLKQRLGNMRRELRKNMGQLVGEKGGNKKQIAAIQALLNESLTQIPSAPVDPHDFIMDKRDPVEGASHNESQLPSLFIYLLNQFSKAVINQFIQECGAQPKTADPIGVITAMIFSNKAYLWRGRTLIDILIAKFRVVCPVLFGYRGDERTEQGRVRLGWKKEGGGWAPEQAHIDRMKGLAVGFASISLRDFSKSTNKNPWPPSKYWASLARIVNTPPAEISNTQSVVLRSMIEHYEERFMGFYGTAAIAALRKALVEYPTKAQTKTPGIGGLLVLGEMLKMNVGLEL